MVCRGQERTRGRRVNIEEKGKGEGGKEVRRKVKRRKAKGKRC